MIRRPIDLVRAAGLGILLLVTAGCGAKSSSLAEVSGTVTLDGKPLPGVEVSFYPIGDKGAQPLPASKGKSDESGKFTLTCIDARPGAFVGKHKVMVTLPKERDVSPKLVIPLVYMTLATTPIEKEVTSGPNNISVELTR